MLGRDGSMVGLVVHVHGAPLRLSSLMAGKIRVFMGKPEPPFVSRTVRPLSWISKTSEEAPWEIGMVKLKA